MIKVAQLCTALLAVGVYAANPTVSLKSGVIQGTTTTLPSATAAVNQFLGVPFAASPPERFSVPKPAAPWSHVKNTTKRSAACIQQFVYPEKQREVTMKVFNNPFGPPPAESEDCLYLNVFTPSTPAPAGGREVLFWIFGGGNMFGTGNLQIVDGSSFAANQDVIVVTINYRTNVFGFPSAPQLPAGKNNLGLLDQQFAMQWVQDNIASFGGDPKKVTLFGESAGAENIDSHILHYTTEDAPFRAAIMESGQTTFGPLAVDTGNQTAWNQLVAALNCSDTDPSSTEAFQCVKTAPANTIKSIVEHQMLPFLPIPDGGVTLVDHPLQERMAGNFAHVPVLFGTNAQEDRVFEIGQNNITEFVNEMFAAFPSAKPVILNAYPVNPQATDYDVISQISTDYAFTCAAQGYQNISIAEGVPAWRYYFNASFPNDNPEPSLPLGVFHSSEIPLVFGTYQKENATNQEVKLSAFMQKAWADFAKNPTTGPGWTQVGKPAFSVAAIGSNGSTGETIFDPRSNVDVRCAAFNVPYNAEDSA